jgi:hypothetical protein
MGHPGRVALRLRQTASMTTRERFRRHIDTLNDSIRQTREDAARGLTSNAERDEAIAHLMDLLNDQLQKLGKI